VTIHVRHSTDPSRKRGLDVARDMMCCLFN
jgi:hypothetical protein